MINTRSIVALAASIALCSAILLPAAAQVAGPAPIDDHLLPSRAVRAVIFVPPAYPADALQRSAGAIVDVIGRVRTHGAFDVVRIESDSTDDTFQAAVSDVARHWLMRPRYDKECRVVDEESQLRIWFEVKDGKPSISISTPTIVQPPKPDRSEDPLYQTLERRDPVYPREAQRAGIEGKVEVLMRLADSGEVEEVIVVPGRYSGNFANSVTDATRRWRYVAAKRPNRCVRYDFVFQLRTRFF